jgi:hypothetical protein
MDRSLGDLSREWNEPIHRLAYVLEMNGIQHTRRAGFVRLYSPEAVERIRSGLDGLRPYRRRETAMEAGGDERAVAVG